MHFCQVSLGTRFSGQISIQYLVLYLIPKYHTTTFSENYSKYGTWEVITYIMLQTLQQRDYICKTNLQNTKCICVAVKRSNCHSQQLQQLAAQLYLARTWTDRPTAILMMLAGAMTLNAILPTAVQQARRLPQTSRYVFYQHPSSRIFSAFTVLLTMR